MRHLPKSHQALVSYYEDSVQRQLGGPFYELSTLYGISVGLESSKGRKLFYSVGQRNSGGGMTKLVLPEATTALNSEAHILLLLSSRFRISSVQPRERPKSKSGTFDSWLRTEADDAPAVPLHVSPTRCGECVRLHRACRRRREPSPMKDFVLRGLCTLCERRACFPVVGWFPVRSHQGTRAGSFQLPMTRLISIRRAGVR